ncbi:MAG: type II toxin-antitoxin system VapC family toxin [Desulfobulbaceae bacterium]|nr:type II toxin-antitoxin system VapC family toxin [Desulfobulbaceae bacterium]
MRYLLDTCVISELIKKKPNPKIVQWIAKEEENNLFMRVLTIGEIHKGIEKLPESRKKEKLHDWVRYDLEERFQDRILNFDLQAAVIWGRIQAHSELTGRAMPAIDGLIAATGLSSGLTVVTRNTTDMEMSGVTLINPWP